VVELSWRRGRGGRWRWWRRRRRSITSRQFTHHSIIFLDVYAQDRV